MGRSKVPKNLEVDGTAKLAARAKASDKHEKAELNIEEATVASPRRTRKRAGDYFDFDGEDTASEESSRAVTNSKAEKPKKKPKTAATDKAEKLSKVELKTVAKGEKAKTVDNDSSDAVTDKTTKAAAEKKARNTKAAKEGALKKGRPEASKKSRKESKQPAVDDEPSADATEMPTEQSEKKSKRSKVVTKKAVVEQVSTVIDTDVAMDAGPFESLMESEHAIIQEETEKEPFINSKETKGSEATKKATKVSKPQTVKQNLSKAAAGAVDTATNVAEDGVDKVKKTAKATKDAFVEAAESGEKEIKDGAEKLKKSVKSKIPSTETMAEVAESATKATQKGAEKVKKAVKSKVPSTQTVAEAAESAQEETRKGAEKVKKAVKSKVPSTEPAAEAAGSAQEETQKGAEKVKKAGKSKIPSTETAAEVADSVRKEAQVGAEKVKKAVKGKQAGKPKDVVVEAASVNDQSMSDGSTLKKRKASSGDAETVKADILDPLAEHAEASANKKRKKEKAQSKSLGDTVGGMITTATEGASAARASLGGIAGGIASSLMGGATEVAEAAADVKNLAESATEKAKGKGKAIAEDVVESIGKLTGAGSGLSSGTDESETDSDAEPDDHTAALLAGFQSEEDEAPKASTGFEDGTELPELPNAKKVAKKIKGIKAGADEGTGVVYVGRIPHGFYEHQMRQYFSQFGDISRLRLSRNRKTGASRHWAFLEFKSASVAKIVADTMDNYLMFGHILKCKVVPKEQLHENVWKGADKRFKKVPWNAMEGRKHEVAVGRDQWNARNENEEQRRVSKKEKMKEIGYEFEAPPLKSVDQIPVKDNTKTIGTEETFEEEQSLVTAQAEDGGSPMVISEEVKTKTTKKSNKGQPKETTMTVTKKTKRTLEDGGETAGFVVKKAKKAKGAVT